MWFLFGATAVLALTVVRLLPVFIAMLGSTYSWPERLMIGWPGLLHGVGAPTAARAYRSSQTRLVG